MKKIIIESGVCGEKVEVTADSQDGRHVTVRVGKCCQFIERMKPDLEKEPLDAYRLMSNILNSPIYQSASRCLPHVTCPVPSAIHKVIEAEAGLAVPVDVKITFERDGGKE